MTDEELKRKLLMFSKPLGWHRNPEGPQAVARIKELGVQLSDAIEQRDELGKDASYLQVRIEELEAKNAKLKAQRFGAIHKDGSRSGGQPIKGTDDDG
jgi:FtsZ-binding cell division protein ZapB